MAELTFPRRAGLGDRALAPATLDLLREVWEAEPYMTPSAIRRSLTGQSGKFTRRSDGRGRGAAFGAALPPLSRALATLRGSHTNTQRRRSHGIGEGSFLLNSLQLI